MKRERLIRERKKRNKTQADIAEALGISEVYVRKLESGSVKPGRNTMIKFESYYNLGSKKLFPDVFLQGMIKNLSKTGTE